MTRDLISATGLMMALLLSLSHAPSTLAQETPRTADGRPISRDTGLPPGVRCASLKRPATLR